MPKKYSRSSILFLWVCFIMFASPFSAISHDTNDTYGPRGMINFREFPTNPRLYNDELKPFVSRIVQRHGLEEWKAIVLTNELHHHMGLWSIVGAKMGVRAREILKAPFDRIEVISYTGIKPPFSCLNDGIQASTGASLGRGAIRVIDKGQPSADFIFDSKKVTMKVKPEIAKEIEEIIKRCSDRYVFQSHRYFKELDRISLEYWLKWDRTRLFEEITAPL